MKEYFTFPKRLKQICLVLIVIGVLTFAYGFLTDPDKTWANYLLNNVLFISLSIGATFFLAIQHITQSGWSAGFKRISEALGAYIPFSFILFLLLGFGLHTLYHWSHTEVLEHDALLQHKSPYLNTPFFLIRLAVFFISWIILYKILRHLSLKEDQEGGLTFFKKSELYSKIFIFVLALTFSLAGVDWLMSLDPHWFSTIYALKIFVSAFLHGICAIALIVIFLNKQGYLSFLNKSHLHDFSRYIFIVSIFWGWFWFSQYTLIWYANIPEETIYFVPRLSPEWKPIFILNILLNWAIPFVVLMPRYTSRNSTIMTIVIIGLMIGHWIEMYFAVMPSTTTKENSIGLIEIGSYLGFLGLFAFITFTALSRAKLIPKNHPYLEESLKHHF